MEFKETKVATLSKNERVLWEEISRTQKEMSDATSKAKASYELFWQHLILEYGLPGGKTCFIKDNSIYKYDLE